MSRLRRPFITGKIFFVTCNILRTRPAFADREFEVLGRAFETVRKRRSFSLMGYVFMPDHWHGLILPAEKDTLPRLMSALKITSNRALNRYRSTQGEFWQPRYYDHAIRTVKEFRDALQYMHLNPVKRGLVNRPEDWAWSSFRSYGGPGEAGLRVDLIDLPLDEYARL